MSFQRYKADWFYSFYEEILLQLTRKKPKSILQNPGQLPILYFNHTELLELRRDTEDSFADMNKRLEDLKQSSAHL